MDIRTRDIQTKTKVNNECIIYSPFINWLYVLASNISHNHPRKTDIQTEGLFVEFRFSILF